MLPFSDFIAKLTERIIPVLPEETRSKRERQLIYLVDTSKTLPTVTIRQAMLETERMGKISRDNVRDAVEAFFHKDDELLEKDAFLEHATVHGNRYGTLKSQVAKLMAEGKNVLLDIDPQGARQVLKNADDCVSVFILPPSFKTLRQRLHTRNTDDPVEIDRRVHNAHEEVQHVSMYDYTIINDDLDTAFGQLKTIIEAEKLSTARYLPVVEEE